MFISIRTHKIFLTVLLLVMVAIPTFSQKDSTKYIQTNKGKFLVGINANFYANKDGTEGIKSLIFQVEPRIGYFLFRNFAVGLKGNYNYERTNYNYYNEKYVSNEFNAGPFARYYLRYRNHGLFGEVAYSYGKNIARITEYMPGIFPNFIKITTVSNSYSFGAGYCYFVAKNVSLELLYQFQKATVSDQWSSGNNSFPFTKQQINNNIVTLGFQFYF